MSVQRLPAGHKVEAVDYNRLLSGQVNDGYVYYGATTGWKLPWQMPWGRVAAVHTSGFGAFGIGGSGASTAAGVLATVDSLGSITLPANRWYRFTCTVQMYSPAGATNCVMYVLDDGAAVAQSERVPSTVAGSAIFSSFLRNTVSAADTSVWTSGVQFSGAAGFVLQDGARYSNLIIEDVGPFGAAPTS